ncbi:TlpA family protein disulfide reductase [Flavobacterium sp. GB2R13]|uniref:TlpA family protein disulfide reductase n=1 Tax=Flavobacterium algoris TaxID=3398733 RepID=UPI003A87E8A7
MRCLLLSFDYDNYAGGKTKLEDLKGKYVYIDVWATWCGPCRAEIPFKKKNEGKYHDKNISFVSISIDVQKDMEKWKTLIKDKELGGIQLFADNDWNSKFAKDYGINSIPRFILIDPNGKIINADALRPSAPKLEIQLNTLLN